MRGTILVVGAGFAGATHARELAEAGWHVELIDRRAHIAGNAYDHVGASGVRIHRYGPHLFHTNTARVVDWLSRFGEFLPYEHRVAAALPDGRQVPLPVNRQTINAVFGLALPDAAAVQAFLATQAVPIAQPANAAEHLLAHIGQTLTNLFFRPYTRKMWALDLEELDAAVVKRIPIRFDDEDRYFPNDRFQLLPRDGYTALFARMLDHPAIRVSLGQAFDRAMLQSCAHCFNSMPIDEYFDDAFGPLPYRSIRFHHAEVPRRSRPATLNLTDESRYTRETDWSRLPGHVVAAGPQTTLTREEPCDYLANDKERYYPVKTSDGRYDAAYHRYRTLAAQDEKNSFIGRCGTYQYLDMHQVINQSLQNVRGWIERQD